MHTLDWCSRTDRNWETRGNELLDERHGHFIRIDTAKLPSPKSVMSIAPAHRTESISPLWLWIILNVYHSVLPKCSISLPIIICISMRTGGGWANLLPTSPIFYFFPHLRCLRCFFPQMCACIITERCAWSEGVEMEIQSSWTWPPATVLMFGVWTVVGPGVLLLT